MSKLASIDIYSPNNYFGNYMNDDGKTVSGLLEKEG